MATHLGSIGRIFLAGVMTPVALGLIGYAGFLELSLLLSLAGGFPSDWWALVIVAVITALPLCTLGLVVADTFEQPRDVCDSRKLLRGSGYWLVTGIMSVVTAILLILGVFLASAATGHSVY